MSAEEDVKDEDLSSQQDEDDDLPQYKILITKGNKQSFVTYEDVDLVVAPPEKSARMNMEQWKLKFKCKPQCCYHIPHWSDASISFDDTEKHLKTSHKNFHLTRC